MKTLIKILCLSVWLMAPTCSHPGDCDYDECGVYCGYGAIYECGCSDMPTGDCDCFGNVEDCWGICGGSITDSDLDGICDDVDDCIDIDNDSICDNVDSCVPGVVLWNECYNINTIYLYLSENNLSGSIPAEIGNLTNLQHLYLNGNQLTGEIPSEIGNLTNLIFLRLHDNQLSGEIPAEIGNLINLKRLYFNNNQLSGEIPSEIGNLINLEIFNLSNNQLSGLVPNSVCNLDPMTDHYFEDGYWHIIYNLNFTENLLCAPYPNCISNGEILPQDTSNCP